VKEGNGMQANDPTAFDDAFDDVRVLSMKAGDRVIVYVHNRDQSSYRERVGAISRIMRGDRPVVTSSRTALYWIVVEFANGERDTVLSCYVRLAPETASIS
jgi:hypothetical protein